MGSGDKVQDREPAAIEEGLIVETRIAVVWNNVSLVYPSNCILRRRQVIHTDAAPNFGGAAAGCPESVNAAREVPVTIPWDWGRNTFSCSGG